jgi:photosystem II stability/assembly factor-like uncharacterized protein
MVMKTAGSCISLLLAVNVAAGQPASWTSRGIGGGGSLYALSINPANTNEFFAGCDMSGLYHTTDFGVSYQLLNSTRIQGGHNSRVQFTNSPLTLYCISYSNDTGFPVKSTDGGNTWSPLPGNPDPTEETYTIAVDYAAPDRIVIGYYGSIFFSGNGGATFAQIHAARNAGSGVTIGGVFFDGNNIFLGTSDGLLVSSNGGGNFAIATVPGIATGQRMFSFAGAKQGSLTRLYCLTADSTDIYTGLPGSDYWNFMKGVYALNYGSGPWNPRMNGITVGTDFPMFVAASASDTGVVYLGGSNSSGEPNILKSTNGGGSWNRAFQTSGNANIATGWSGAGGDRGWGYGECVFSFEVARNDPQRVLFSDFGFIHATTNGGTSWRQAYLSPADQNAAASPTPTGKSYHGNGLEVTSCWQLVWADATNLFACFSDIRGLRSTDAGLSWSFNYTGHTANTMYRIAAQPSSGEWFAATSNVHDMYQSTRLADAQLDAADAGGKIIVSTDRGAHWTDLHAFGHPVFWVALDPSDPKRIYASVVHSTLGGIYTSGNLQDGQASQWSRLPNPPRTEGHPASIVVLNDGKVVCTYSGRRTTSGFTASSGVFVYSPGTGTWADVSDPGMRYWTKDIVLDPDDASQNSWLVGVFSGWGGPPNGLGGLYRTTDRGASWKRISALDRVTSCTFNPSVHGEAYLTTETEGLWYSADVHTSSPSFSRVQSFPFRQPERVFFNPFHAGDMWVTSFGAGMLTAGVPATGFAPSGPSEPDIISLEQNYPNPFNPGTMLVFHVQESGTGTTHVRLAIFDLLGREIATPVDEKKSPGTYTLWWTAPGCASGVYVARLTAGSVQVNRKILLLR